MAIAAYGMQQDQLRMETISQNLANVLTPGYKKQLVVGQGFAAQVAQGLAPAGAASLAIDPAAGTLRYTGDVQDVAVEGADFFEIAGPDGLAYTRKGHFHADVRGRLVGDHGWPVMGSAGEVIVNGPYTIDSHGDVRQGEQVVARLKLVRFTHPEALLPEGDGLYRQGAAQPADAGPAPALKVGFQENSNVNSAQEMVRLSETVRHFEALQKVIQGYDDSQEKAIRKLGEF